jgi:citrate lyase beta subunit
MTMRVRRTLLFAPGNRAEIHAKALVAGADVVCLDLEDAVPPQAKSEARAIAVPFLVEASGPERVVRINSPRSADGLRDLLAIVEARPKAGVIFLPKVSSPEEVRWVAEILDEAGLDLRLAVLLESIEGIDKAAAILRASQRIAFAMFGGADLAAELGVEIAHEPLLYARSRVVAAARAAMIDCFDVPCIAFRDDAKVRHEAETARALGFTGKAVLHPGNVATVNTAFAPTEAEIERAEAVMAAYRASPNGLAVVDGKLVERPVVLAQQRILNMRDLIRSSNP